MQKYFRHILFLMLVVSINFACTRKTVVVVQQKKDNGKHKGWYKNPNNPHHPASVKHQSKGKGGTTVIVNNNNKSSASANGNSKIKPGNGNASAKGNPGKGNGNGHGKGKK